MGSSAFQAPKLCRGYQLPTGGMEGLQAKLAAFHNQPLIQPRSPESPRQRLQQQMQHMEQPPDTMVTDKVLDTHIPQAGLGSWGSPVAASSGTVDSSAAVAAQVPSGEPVCLLPPHASKRCKSLTGQLRRKHNHVKSTTTSSSQRLSSASKMHHKQSAKKALGTSQELPMALSVDAGDALVHVMRAGLTLPTPGSSNSSSSRAAAGSLNRLGSSGTRPVRSPGQADRAQLEGFQTYVQAVQQEMEELRRAAAKREASNKQLHAIYRSQGALMAQYRLATTRLQQEVLHLKQQLARSRSDVFGLQAAHAAAVEAAEKEIAGLTLQLNAATDQLSEAERQAANGLESRWQVAAAGQRIVSANIQLGAARGAVDQLEGQHVQQLLALQQQLVRASEVHKQCQQEAAVSQVEARKAHRLVDMLRQELFEARREVAKLEAQLAAAARNSEELSHTNQRLLQDHMGQEQEDVLSQELLASQEKMAAAQASLAVALAEQQAGKQELLLTQAALAEQQDYAQALAEELLMFKELIKGALQGREGALQQAATLLAQQPDSPPPPSGPCTNAVPLRDADVPRAAADGRHADSLLHKLQEPESASTVGQKSAAEPSDAGQPELLQRGSVAWAISQMLGSPGVAELYQQRMSSGGSAAATLTQWQQASDRCTSLQRGISLGAGGERQQSTPATSQLAVDSVDQGGEGRRPEGGEQEVQETGTGPSNRLDQGASGDMKGLQPQESSASPIQGVLGPDDLLSLPHLAMTWHSSDREQPCPQQAVARRQHSRAFSPPLSPAGPVVQGLQTHTAGSQQQPPQQQLDGADTLTQQLRTMQQHDVGVAACSQAGNQPGHQGPAVEQVQAGAISGAGAAANALPELLQGMARERLDLQQLPGQGTSASPLFKASTVQDRSQHVADLGGTAALQGSLRRTQGQTKASKPRRRLFRGMGKLLLLQCGRVQVHPGSLGGAAPSARMAAGSRTRIGSGAVCTKATCSRSSTQ